MYDIKKLYHFCHRDLKPSNILMKNDEIKICDFATGKKIRNCTTQTKGIGTPLY